MKKQLVALGLLFTAISVGAQMKNTESDTVRIQTIEDVNLHKTGNPEQGETFIHQVEPYRYGDSATHCHRHP